MSRKRLSPSLAVASLMVLSLPAIAADCRFEPGDLLPGSVQRPLIVDATCTDPDYNDDSFVIDQVTHDNRLPAPYAQMPFTKVAAHFKVGNQTHGVTFYFPPKAHWQNRFFQHLYPLPQSGNFPDRLAPNIASEVNFSLTSGGYMIDTEPGNAQVGYRLDAAAAKIAKAYANKLYENSRRVYGYAWGGSGGSYQTQGALEETNGVWDGAIPYVIATAGLTSTGAQQSSLYAMRIPLEKRRTIAAAAAPGSGQDVYADLNPDDKAALLEFLRFGFPLRALETTSQTVGNGIFGDGRAIDPTYEEDFWTKPGYEGASPPPYIKAALVDHLATITAINRNDQGMPTSLTLDSAPTLGSTGATGLEYYVYAPDGVTRIRGASEARSQLSGNRNASPTTFTITGNNDPALINGLQVGGKLRINNRYLIAVAHYPRHSLPKDGSNIQNDQYRRPDGTPIYPQRQVNAQEPAGTRTTGGVLPTGKINFKTIAVTNLMDVSAFHLTGAAYAQMVRNRMGKRNYDQMFRIYYQDNADHFDRLTIAANASDKLVTYVPILYQSLRDLSAWVEEGVRPPASTQYRVVDGQVLVPPEAAARRGIQPVVSLQVNGSDRAVVGVNQSVQLTGTIQAPPKTGSVVSYDWYLGGSPVAYEAPVVLTNPQPSTSVQRSVSFPNPGTYFISLRGKSQRDGKVDDPTVLQNLARVRIVVQ